MIMVNRFSFFPSFFFTHLITKSITHPLTNSLIPGFPHGQAESRANLNVLKSWKIPGTILWAGKSENLEMLREKSGNFALDHSFA